MSIDHELLNALASNSNSGRRTPLRDIRALAPTIAEAALNGYSLKEIHQVAKDLGRLDCCYRTFREQVVQYVFGGKRLSEFRRSASPQGLSSLSTEASGRPSHAADDSDGSADTRGPKRLRVAHPSVSHDPKPDLNDLIGGSH